MSHNKLRLVEPGQWHASANAGTWSPFGSIFLNDDGTYYLVRMAWVHQELESQAGRYYKKFRHAKKELLKWVNA